MHKSALAVLALLAGALAANTASPAFAATGASPLNTGPRITITVSCQDGEHAVEHLGQYSCAADAHARHQKQDSGKQDSGKREDRTRHHRTRHITLARHTAPAPSWQHCRLRHRALWASPYFHFWNWGHTSHVRWH
jgi:hypothetical protein